MSSSTSLAGAGKWVARACDEPVKIIERIRRGYHPTRGPDIVLVAKGLNFFGGFSTTTHSGPSDYLQKVPLVLYGPGFIEHRGAISLDREVTVADLAPTFAELLGTPFPDDYAGRPIEEALVPREQRPAPPKLIMTIVWDGGGWNVLDQWPDAWPHLSEMMTGGTSVEDATVGSSPSITPSIHTTIGTGTWPSQHGIVDMVFRVGDEIVGSFIGLSAKNLEVPTLADLYDRATGNVAKIGLIGLRAWHIGMVGHGAALEGGDKDIVGIGELSTGRLRTQTEHYSLPPYLNDVPGMEDDIRTVDMGDGEVDGLWMGHDLLGNVEDVIDSPAWVPYQTRLLEALIEGEGFGQDEVGDLIFTNYKQIDLLGHAWNMLNPEVEDALRYSDAQLPRLEEFLNEEVGEGQWVLALTADHGQQPDALAVGAIPIAITELVDDIGERFDVDPKELVEQDRPTALWLNGDFMAERGITADEISDFLVDYRFKENAIHTFPDEYDDRMDERLFSAAFPGARLDEVLRCARGKR
jgi:predicted AlkP superfamily pyrophosphatase or phosphodiesterase